MVYDGPIPEKVGRYEIVLQIARGGMATVYLARAEGVGGFDRYVALKLTAEHLRDDEEFAQHLIDEAKLVAHLRHTNVVPVLDVGEDSTGGAIFLVMDYIPGDSLGGLMRLAKRGGDVLPPRIGLRVLVDALSGLHAAHEHTDEDGNSYRLVHRDFSPQNILVGTDGIARLTDFGIAKAASRVSMTMAGTMKGKVSYASPEQARGKELDRRCDVWAGGVVAWELLANRKLYPAGENTLREIVKAPPPRIRTVVPAIHADIEEAIANALAMEAEGRTPTAQAFGRALGAAARAAGLLAEIDEVADYVKKAVAPILLERKAKIDEARRMREELDIVEGPDEAGVTATKTFPFASLPDLPMEPGVTVESDATVPMDREALAQLVRPGAGAPAPDPEPDAERPPESQFTPSFTPSGTTSSADPPPPRISGGRWDRARVEALANAALGEGHRLYAEKPRVVLGIAAGAGGLVALLVVLAALGGRDDPKEGSIAGLALRASAELARSASPPMAPSRASPRPATTLEDAEPLPTRVEVAANAPITRVRIGKRSVDVEVAAPRVAVELTNDESSTTLPITLTSNDGRTTTGTWNPGDGEMALTFGDVPGRGRPRPRR